jgi:uncharacterized membrane protein YdbT with pleckstrin-like domain
MAAQNSYQGSYPINIGKSILAGLFSLIITFAVLFFIGLVFLFIFPVVTLVLFMFMGFILFLSVISFIFQYLYLINLSYEVNDKNFVLKGGIIGKFEKILPYSKLQHVIVNQSWGQRIFGISTVCIQDASQQVIMQGRNQGPVIDVPTIPGLFKEDALKLRDFIIIEILKTKSGQGI